MTNVVAAQIGSGTLPYVRGILPSSQRGNQVGSEGVRTGMQVMLANPEDLNSVDAYMPSGVTVGTGTVVEVISPGKNPLPRCRDIYFGNFTTSTVIYLGPWNNIGKLIAEGIPLPVGSSQNSDPFGLKMPLLHNNTVYAIATGGAAVLRMLIL